MRTRKLQKTRRKERDRERAYRRWTRGEDAQLVAEIRKGLTVEQISVAHRRSTKAIDTRCVKLQMDLARRGNKGATKATTTTKSSLLGRLFSRQRRQRGFGS